MKKRLFKARRPEKLDRAFWLALGSILLTASAGWADGSSQNSIRSIWATVRWSPYVVGAGIGVLSWLAFVLSDKPIGVSTAYAQSAGMIEKTIRGSEVEEKPYYREYVPRISWTWMLVIGIIVGAFISARLSGDFQLRWIPPLWEEKIGDSVFFRWLAAFIGGAILGIGARWADGCTSGHGISGALQLVVSSWVAVICFFAGGVIAAQLLFLLFGVN
jgi:hypothetical protein